MLKTKQNFSTDILQNNKINEIFHKEFASVHSDLKSLDLERFRKNANQILEKSLNSEGKLWVQNKKGLVIGKIQSGKTNNYLHVISTFLTHGAEIVIVIGGLDNKILQQTFERMRFFEKLNATNEKFLPQFKVICSKTGIKPEMYSIINTRLSQGKEKIIIVSMKEDDNLNRIIDIFFQNSPLRERKILIIDDEGDQASLDGNKNLSKEEKTKINEQINKMFDILTNFHYLSITATPYANVLLEKHDSLSPDFVQLLPPGEEYFGLHELMKKQEKLIIEISSKDGENFIKSDLSKSIPESFIKALSAFVVSSYLREIETDRNNLNNQMLVHIDSKIESHQNIYQKIFSWLQRQNNFFSQQETFVAFLKKGFEIIRQTIPDLKINLNQKKTIKKLRELFDQIQPILMNSDTDNEKNSFEYRSNMEMFIGGKLLERGITFNNLLTTYITRRAKNKSQMDTTLQRARWLGYRNHIKKYLRIFMSSEIICDFTDIDFSEQQLWYSFSKIEKNKVPYENWEPYIMNYSPKLNITSDRRVEVQRENFQKLKIAHIQRSVYKNQNNEQEWIRDLLLHAKKQKYGDKVHSEICFQDYSTFVDYSHQNFGMLQMILWKKLFISRDIYENEICFSLKNEFKFKFIFISNKDKKNYVKCFHAHDILQSCQVQIYEEGTQNYLGDMYLDSYEENKDTFLLLIYQKRIKCAKNKTEKNSLFYILLSPIKFFFEKNIKKSKFYF